MFIDYTLRTANKSAEYIAEELGRCGIRMDRLPRIRYVNKDILTYSGLVVMPTDTAARTGSPITTYCLADHLRFFQKHGLDASEDAVTELWEERCRRWGLEDFSVHFEEGDDIVLFHGFRNMLANMSVTQGYNARALRIIAKEMWHIIERDAGLTGGNRLITDGTAEAAATYLTNTGMNMNESYSMVTDFVTRDVGNMAYREAGRGWNPLRRSPLKSLLKPGVRRIISRKALKELKRSNIPVPDIIQDELENEYNGTESMRLLLEMPTKGGLQAFYRNIGAHKLADEVETQDVSALLEAYKKKGASVSAAMHNP